MRHHAILATGIFRWRPSFLLLWAATLVVANSPGVLASPVNIYGPRELKEGLADYHEKTANLEFKYPKTWQIASDPGKDDLVKISGSTQDGKFGQVKIAHLNGVSDPHTGMNMMTSEFARSLPNYKKIEERQIRFGSSYQYIGDELQLHFDMGENAFRDRLVFFNSGGSVYCCSFLCKESEAGLMPPTFDAILASMHHTQDANTRPAAATAPIKTSWKLATYTDKSGQLSIGYPEGWRLINNDPGRELDIKFHGRNDQNLDAELFISRMDRPPTLSMDQFAQTYEQTYLKSLPKYKTEPSHSTTFGVTRTEGLINYCSFTVEGQPARQANAFFSDSKHYYCVALNTVGWTASESKELFERVLQTVKVTDL